MPLVCPGVGWFGSSTVAKITLGMLAGDPAHRVKLHERANRRAAEKLSADVVTPLRLGSATSRWQLVPSPAMLHRLPPPPWTPDGPGAGGEASTCEAQ